MKKFFVFVAGIVGFWLGLFFFKIVVPEFSDSRMFIWFFSCTIVSLVTALNANIDIEWEIFRASKTKKLIAILLGSLLGGITAVIFDVVDFDNEYVFFLAPFVSYIATQIILEGKAFNDIEIGEFFRSKVWLILQILWIVLVIFTAKYDSYYPQKVYLFYSFFRTSYRTTGLMQALILALPFITNIYYWFKK